MVRLEPACEVEQETAGRGHVDTPIRALQDRLHPGPLALRQMIEDVAQLVHLAALDKGDLAEGVAHGFPQDLRTIENHEQAAVGSQATALQICEQRLAQGRVLVEPSHRPRACFWPSAAIPSATNTQCSPTWTPSSTRPDQVEGVEWLRLPGFQLRARFCDEPPAHGALASAATSDPGRTGSKLRAYWRVATPTSICSTTRRFSGSVSAKD